MGKITENIKLDSYEDLFKASNIDEKEANIVEIPVSLLKEFRNHPFNVLDDNKMDELVTSIKENGVLVPAIARKLDGGTYELISGHRRHRACELAELDSMPVIVKDLNDDEATIIMVDSNLQREELLVSERARAFSQRYEACKHQGRKGGYVLDEIGDSVGENRKQIQRYIWIARLLDELLDMVDNKKLGFCQGVDISFLTKEEQAAVLLEMKMNEVKMSLKQSALLKKLSQENALSNEKIREILSKPLLVKRTFSMNESKINSYFDERYSSEDIKKVIYNLLDQWKQGVN